MPRSTISSDEGGGADGRTEGSSDGLGELDRWIDEFISHSLSEKGLAANTLSAYRRDLAMWRRFCAQRSISPRAVRPSDLTEFLERLRAGAPPASRSLSASSVARMLVSVRLLYRFLAREGVLSVDPAATLGAPRRGRPLPRAIGVREVEALIELPASDLLGRRDKAMLETLYGAGLRISELAGLDLADVDLDDRTLLVRGGKGGKSRRVPLGRAARSALSRYCALTRPELAARSSGPRTNALFLNARGGRLSRQGCWKILKRYARAAGLERRVSPHTLRHSFATHMLDAGADIRVVQELLGHANLTTTQVYTFVSDRRVREVYSAAHPRARG